MNKKIKNLITSLSKLPGIGEKSALRYALWCINNSADAIEISDNIKSALDLNKCKYCNNLCENEICDICKDETRDRSIVCVVESMETLFNLESQNVFNGLYFVLWGLVSPIDGVFAEDLQLNKLVDLAKNAKEVILMLDDSPEGNLTAHYIIEILSLSTKISKPASGIPVGYSINSLDRLTLQKALKYRVPY